MNTIKKIAFVFGRPVLNTAKLQFMPFALSSLKKLAENERYQIDVYLTQSKTSDYKDLLPSNVTIIFLDKEYVWSKGSGFKLYLLLNFYFWSLTYKIKYSKVFGVGQVGVVLGGKLARRNKAKFICLNDEFPDISYLKVWCQNEKKYTALAHTVILPDECRIAILKKQVNFGKGTIFNVLPNIPLQKDIHEIQIDWKQRLSLNSNAKLIIYAGGISRENNIDFLLTVFPFTPSEFILVMVGNGNKYKNDAYFNHSRIVWIENPLTDDELGALISQAICTVAYYANFLDLEYVGKSSGKIMRSLLLGTPVITTNFQSLKFIEDDGMGELISKPFDLVAAIKQIDANRINYVNNINLHMKKYLFENYWKQIEFPI